MFKVNSQKTLKMNTTSEGTTLLTHKVVQILVFLCATIFPKLVELRWKDARM